MSAFFLKVVNMSISASWLVLAVLLLRLVLKKAPKWVSVLLWGFVAIRLIYPFSIESMLSLIPSAETISPEIMMDWTPEISTGIGSVDAVVNPIITESFAPKPYASANPLQILIPVFGNLWVLGILAMLVYTAVSYILLRRKIATAVLLRNNIYQSENVDSPFVLGIIKPKIYLPFRMDSQNLAHVIAHEESHIRRKDHWWKPFGFLLLAIHWFNPLLWLGYILLCRDIELACDEKVIKEMDNESKADYTQALVACSVNRRSIAACPLAFGEVGVKERVKSVMNYKKPAFWVIVAAIVACVVVAVCFLTNPKETSAGALANIYSHTYVVQEVTYESGSYSFSVVVGENSPIYTVSEGMMLASQKEVSEEGIWAELGKLEKTTLSKENFDALFFSNGLWADNASAKSIRKNTVNAWQLIYNEETLYYVLQQKNGDLYLAYGYYDFSEKNDPYSDDTNIRWLYKLAMANSADVRNPVHFAADDISISLLKEYYPGYFGLDAANGLDVYVWQMAKDSYSFGLLPHSETARDWVSSELMELQGASADEMRRILATYDIAQDEIYVIPWQNPISSYIPECWVIREGDDLEEKAKTYLENIRAMLFSETPPAGNEIIAKSGDCSVPLISFPKETDIADYVDSLHWLTINPGEDELAPFGVYKDGEYVIAICSAVDAKTFEPLDFFLPSGLAPQTYLFQNADPSRDYVVLVRFAQASDAEVYAFGARFDRSLSQMAEQHTKIDNVDKAITKAIVEHNAGDRFKPDGLIKFESHVILGITSKSGTPLIGQTNHMEETTVYIQYAYHRYSHSEGELKQVAGIVAPAAITFSYTPESGYTLNEFWEPNGGSTYAEEVRNGFPSKIADIILDPQSDIIDTEELEAQCLAKAQEYALSLTN